ncbi:SGNH/GDSL hydrolase family protein [Paenibacillus sp. MBLB4367]|uniref:SGNH/GDSL hydrolase family protein n=1 Tax=Paenibacillus sp. MBLB4367 TaxID=3384767 RepID=UPI003908111D
MKKIFLIGDSISVHYSDYLSALIKERYELVPREGIKEALQNINMPIGGNGGDSARVLGFLKAQEDEERLNYDVLLFNSGLHDIKRIYETMEIQVELSAYEANLREILKLARAHRVMPIFINTTPVDDEIHFSFLKENGGITRYHADVIAYNHAAEKIMRENDVAIIDLNGYTASLGGNLYCDHVHFNDSIRKLQADFIAVKLAEIL